MEVRSPRKETKPDSPEAHGEAGGARNLGDLKAPASESPNIYVLNAFSLIGTAVVAAGWWRVGVDVGIVAVGQSNGVGIRCLIKVRWVPRRRRRCLAYPHSSLDSSQFGSSAACNHPPSFQVHAVPLPLRYRDNAATFCAAVDGRRRTFRLLPKPPTSSTSNFSSSKALTICLKWCTRKAFHFTSVNSIKIPVSYTSTSSIPPIPPAAAAAVAGIPTSAPASPSRAVPMLYPVTVLFARYPSSSPLPSSAPPPSSLLANNGSSVPNVDRGLKSGSRGCDGAESSDDGGGSNDGGGGSDGGGGGSDGGGGGSDGGSVESDDDGTGRDADEGGATAGMVGIRRQWWTW
ncbi:hypothetical protein R3P38DRAFT_2765078 [Favolaschia claudopus]|uniref:Uncharacterized protein n=1 Tax=Favolaschia claudopus TaxID=2862362 RepID=A0AAW0D0Z1_9AGAR